MLAIPVPQFPEITARLMARGRAWKELVGPTSDRCLRDRGLFAASCAMYGIPAVPALDLAHRSGLLGTKVQAQLGNHPQLRDFTEVPSMVLALTSRRDQADPLLVVAAFHVDTRNGPSRNAAGCIMADVDATTGILSSGCAVGARGRSTSFANHPHTGAQIAGRQLPQWHELRLLAQRAYMVFSAWHCVAWDIAITSKGPMLLGGRSAWPPASAPGRRGLRSTRWP
jgi:hypothetical protein